MGDGRENHLWILSAVLQSSLFQSRSVCPSVLNTASWVAPGALVIVYKPHPTNLPQGPKLEPHHLSCPPV